MLTFTTLASGLKPLCPVARSCIIYLKYKKKNHLFAQLQATWDSIVFISHILNVMF